jgi:uncharacterized protein YkwD
MSHFFAPFITLLVALGLLQAPTSGVRFPSVEWFAIQLQQASSTDTTMAAAVLPAIKKVMTATPTAREVVPAVSIVPASTSPTTHETAGVTSSPIRTAVVPQSSEANATVSLSALEQAVLNGLNAARATAGRGALSADAQLSAVARAHSADMLTNDYFSHDDRSGCNAACRYEKNGYAFLSMGENIFWMSGYDLATSAAASKVIDGWQNSPGHRANDLGDFTKVGIGVAQQGSKIYVTADFATPR